MKDLIKLKYQGLDFIVQSYLKDDFANLCEINGSNFRIDFINNTITTSNKESIDWKIKAKTMNIIEISNILKTISNEKE